MPSLVISCQRHSVIRLYVCAWSYTKVCQHDVLQTSCGNLTTL